MKLSNAAPALFLETEESPVARSEEPPSCTSDEPPSGSSTNTLTAPPPTHRAAHDTSFHLKSETPRDHLFAQKSTANWQDWRWQMRNRITSVPKLLEFYPELRTEVGMLDAAAKFPLAITPYYASIIQSLDGKDPVFQMAVPQVTM